MTCAPSPIAVALLLVASWGARVDAQGTHYATFPYGPRAALLGGAVIGSANDVSASYYNPGGLALADSLGFALSLNALERTRVVADGGFIDDEDAGISSTGLAPAMLGGTIHRAAGSRHLFAYSIITRQRANNSVTAIRESLPPGYEAFVLRVDHSRDITERWFGASWAHAVRPHLGIGVTGFAAVRHDSRSTGAGVAGRQLGEGFSRDRARSYAYSHYSVIGKFGALVDYDAFGVGLTVTGPSFKVYGSGDVAYADVDINDQTGPPDPLIAATEEKGLPVSYAHPLSVGMGLRGGGSSFRVYASAEWYASVNAYDVIASTPFSAQSANGEFQYVVSDARSSVFNWSMAVEQRLTESVTGYLSFHTNASSADRPDADLLLGAPDIRTVSAGADLRIAGRSITLGGSFGWATSTSTGLQTLLPLIGLQPPVGFEPLTVHYRSFGIVLGFEL